VNAFGPYLMACATLVVAGVAKARRPSDTARALVALRPGLSPRGAALGVRVASVAEAVLGVLAVAEPRPPLAATVALSYAAFAGFVVFARRRGGVLASCGCFGTADTLATRLHVVLDLAMAVAACAVALSAPPGTVITVLGHQPLAGAPLVVLSSAGTALLLGAMTSLPRLGAVRASVLGSPAGRGARAGTAAGHAAGLEGPAGR
jgi:hypothetical protein